MGATVVFGTDAEPAAGGAIPRDGDPDLETEPDAEGDDTADEGTETGCGCGRSVVLATLASSSPIFCFSWGADSLLSADRDSSLVILCPTIVVGRFSETVVSVVVSVVVGHSALTIAEIWCSQQ